MRFALVITPRWVLLGLSLTMVLPTLVAAQDGTIAGTVRDDATNQGLAGASVFIYALSVGTLSDNDGAFEVRGVPAGTHMVEIQLIGYAIVRQEVTVTAGSESRLDVALSVDAVILGGITAIGTRARPRTVTESAVPVDVIPAREIINQGDVDFANVLRNVVPSFNVNTQPISDAATWTLTVGAQNALNTYPGEFPLAAADSGQRYGEYSPFGFNGGFYYTKLSYSW